MKFRSVARLAALASTCALASAAAHAVNMVGDLDLLSNGTIPPNVMIILDSSQSMDTALDASTRKKCRWKRIFRCRNLSRL